MEIIIAIVAGVVGGLVGAVPFVVARARIRARMATDGLGGIIPGFAAMLISFALMAGEVVLCRLLASGYLLPYSITAIVVFLCAMIGYTATLIRR